MNSSSPSLKRWLKVVIRSLHIVGIAGVSGGIFFELPPEAWRGYVHLAVATGLLLITVDSFSNHHWFTQVRGVAIYCKLGLLCLLGLGPPTSHYSLVAILLISGVIAHAPGKFRYYSLLHRRVINSPNDVKG